MYLAQSSTTHSKREAGNNKNQTWKQAWLAHACLISISIVLLFCFFMLPFYGWLCWKEAIMLIVMLIFCDYARTYAPFLWLIVLIKSHCARGCAHFFCYFACPPFYMRFNLFLAWLPLLFRCFAREHYFPNIPVLLALYSTTLLDTTDYCLKTFPETFYVPY